MTNEFDTISPEELADADKTALLIDAVQNEHPITESSSTALHTAHLLHGLKPESHIPTQEFLERIQHEAETLFPMPSFFARHRISFYTLFGTAAAACAWGVLTLTQQAPTPSTHTTPSLAVEQTNSTTSQTPTEQSNPQAPSLSLNTNTQPAQENNTQAASDALASLQNEITDIENLLDEIDDETQDIASLNTSANVLGNIDDLNTRSTTLSNELSTL